VTQPVSPLSDVPWDRQFGESRQAFAAFVVYRDMGRAERTVPDAYRQAKRKPNARQANGTWNGWSIRWRWPERADAYDEHMDSEARAAEEQTEREAGVRRAELRAAQRERELRIGDQLLEHVEQILRVPILDVRIERDTDTGVVIQHFYPAKWRLVDVAALARVGIDLRRSGLGLSEDADARDLTAILARVLKHVSPHAGERELSDSELEQLDQRRNGASHAE
jgi:hypothetical protein